MVNLGSSLSDALFKSRFERAVQGATPDMRQARAFEELVKRAVQTYGSKVSAVINATYRTESDGDVFADGLAVEFSTTDQDGSDAARRLQKLRQLLDAGLVTPKEHEAKRKEILDDL